jgi:hypothetical protein
MIYIVSKSRLIIVSSDVTIDKRNHNIAVSDVYKRFLEI